MIETMKISNLDCAAAKIMRYERDLQQVLADKNIDWSAQIPASVLDGEPCEKWSIAEHFLYTWDEFKSSNWQCYFNSKPAWIRAKVLGTKMAMRLTSNRKLCAALAEHHAACKEWAAPGDILHDIFNVHDLMRLAAMFSKLDAPVARQLLKLSKAAKTRVMRWYCDLTCSERRRLNYNLRHYGQATFHFRAPQSETLIDELLQCGAIKGGI